MNWMGRFLTRYQDIEVVEIECSAYLLVSLFPDSERNSENLAQVFPALELEILENIQWDQGWLEKLANIFLISLPCFCLILPWLKCFPFHHYP